MKEPNVDTTKKKKKILYSILLSACVLMLATATTLTAYFLSVENNVLEAPTPEVNPPEDEPPKDDNTPPSDEPAPPSSGDDGILFLSPLGNSVCTVEYDAIYTNVTLNQIRVHKGVDFKADEGEQVFAVATGKVEQVSYSEELGNLIVLDHGDGIKSYYRFVEPIDLKAGDSVKKGEVIATVAGAYGTEYKDGTHLHFEITLDGEWQDPAEYFELTFEEK